MENWGELPEYVLAKILSYLNFEDRKSCSQVCRVWALAYQHPPVWTRITFNITKDEQDDESTTYSDYDNVIPQFGKFFKHVTLKINQGNPKNRKIGSGIIEELSSLDERHLTSVDFGFTGENPLFYSGTEYINALKKLFSFNPEILDKTSLSQLTSVDISGLSIGYDDEIIKLLANYHPTLQRLNIVNDILVNKVSPESIVDLITKCQKLVELKVFYTSICDDALIALAEEGRSPLQHLLLSCRRETKYNKLLTSEAWQQVVAKSPEMKVIVHQARNYSRTWDRKIPSEHQCWEIRSRTGCLELFIVGIV